MLILYRFLINFTFILSPLIILIRLLKKKEDINRFKEKLGLFSKKKIGGNLIWFHGASVGEITSIVPLLEKFEKNKKVRQILITSNTLSSTNIIKSLKLKKVIHQFFPIDTNFISKKFINYWQPKKAFFIDSEIWPNTILNLKEKKIPIILINGRITKKSFNRWRLAPGFAEKIFNNFNLCLSSSNESFRYLKALKAKNIKLIGNLKFSQTENTNTPIDKATKNFVRSRKTWCASSTHNTEEIFCGLVHLRLKKKIKNLLTIIIPRHVERVDDIKKDLVNLKLKVHTHLPKKKIPKNTDIYLVNSYGLTKSFYNKCNNVFLGGSLIKHGGQNPLEAVRYGCHILHGPDYSNFTEIYDFLKKNKISTKIKNQKDLIKNLIILLSKKNKTKKIQNKLKNIGKKILKNTYKEINF